MYWFKHVLVFLAQIIHLSKSQNELRSTRNTWTVVTGDWNYDSSTYKRSQVYSLSTDAEIIMFDKQWYNADGRLSVDLTFYTYFAGNADTEFGIVIFNGKAVSWCEWYYVFIKVDKNNAYKIGLTRANAPDHKETKLQETPLRFSFIDGADYTLNIVIQNDIIFDISIDDDPYISYTDTNGYTTTNNGYSGYIEFWSMAKLRFRAKDLRISGSRHTVASIEHENNCVSLEPTKNPSKSPSPAPTDTPTPPTKDPSPSPSKQPSPAPTDDPTEQSTAPSPSPTDIPTKATADPSKSPTPAPTEVPTPSPTHVPTPAPTSQPSPSPTPAPTKVPTPAPTKNPTDAPTPAPTQVPTPAPTDQPIIEPSKSPITHSPTKHPNEEPTPSPTNIPSVSPSTIPTASPTHDPLPEPSGDPTIPNPTSHPSTALPTVYQSTAPPTPYQSTDYDDADSDDNASDRRDAEDAAAKIERDLLWVIFVVGTAIGCVFIAICFILLLWFLRIRRQKKHSDEQVDNVAMAAEPEEKQINIVHISKKDIQSKLKSLSSVPSKPSGLNRVYSNNSNVNTFYSNNASNMSDVNYMYGHSNVNSYPNIISTVSNVSVVALEHGDAHEASDSDNDVIAQLDCNSMPMTLGGDVNAFDDGDDEDDEDDDVVAGITLGY